MFTQAEKQLLIDALIARQQGNQRSKAKTRHPEFQVVYDRVQAELAALVMKVQVLEVKK